MSKLLSDYTNILQNLKLPAHDDLFAVLERCSTVLEEEKSDYRPQAQNDCAGSLLDFRNSSVPLILVPDLHARPDFLLNILKFNLPAGFADSDALCVFDALCQSKVRVICVGDILHTERNQKERWLLAKQDYDNDLWNGPSITAEMTEGISLLNALMELKCQFKENFHILKGNHENILNKSADGDFAFQKYANEGEMTRDFIRESYGDDILYLMSCFENALPLIAACKNCVVSHAEPRESYTFKQLVNAREDPFVVAGLTWTDNDEVMDDTALAIIKNLGYSDLDNCVYFGGHRPVPENYLLRQNGKYIQFHNPLKQNVLLVYPDKKINPDTDIVEVNHE